MEDLAQKGYAWVRVRKYNITVPANSDLTVVEADGEGYLVHLDGIFNDPNIIGVLVLDGVTWDAKLSDVFSAGVVFPRPNLTYVTLYDPTNSQYGYAYTPAYREPFKSRFRLIARNPTSSPITIISGGATYWLKKTQA